MNREEISQWLADSGFEVMPEFNGMFLTLSRGRDNYTLDLRKSGCYVLGTEIYRISIIEVERFMDLVSDFNMNATGIHVHYDVGHDSACLSVMQFFGSSREFCGHFKECLDLIDFQKGRLGEIMDREDVPF